LHVDDYDIDVRTRRRLEEPQAFHRARYIDIPSVNLEMCARDPAPIPIASLNGYGNAVRTTDDEVLERVRTQDAPSDWRTGSGAGHRQDKS